MGFGSNGSWWKKKLAEWAPDAWYYLNEAPVEGIDVVIEDVMFLRFTTKDSKTAYQEKWTNYAGDICKEFPNATEIVALFDEDRSMVPKAKHPEQDKRYRKYEGLTPDECARLGNARYLCHPASNDNEHNMERVFKVDPWPQTETDTSFKTFLKKYQRTPALKEDYMTFMTSCMMNPSEASQQYFSQGKLLRIDRGFINGQRVGMMVRPDGRTQKFDGNGGNGADYIPGEGDLKIGAYLRRYKGRGVWIRCADMDVIPIVLMAIRDLIDQDTQNIEGKIFVDLTPTVFKSKSLVYQKKRHPQVVDMVALWKAIHLKMVRKFSIQSRPVETLCLFMILCGTDFVKKPARLGIMSLWGAFEKGGYVLLARCFQGDNIVGNANWEGRAGLARWIRVNETAIVHFYRYAYTYFKDKKSLSSVSLLVGSHQEAKQDLLQKSLSFKDIAERYAPKKPRTQRAGPTAPKITLEEAVAAAAAAPSLTKRKRVMAPPLNQETAQAEGRRVVWNAYYWVTGHAYPPPNAVQLHPKKGTSMYGWEEDTETGKVIASTSVCSTEALEHVLSPGSQKKRRKKNLPVMKKRTKCRFAPHCYRRNKEHKQRYIHPADADWIRPVLESASLNF